MLVPNTLTYLCTSPSRVEPHPAPTSQRKVLGSECVPPCSLEPSSLAWWSSPPSRLRFCTPCPLAAAARPRLCAWPRTRASATRTTFPPRFAWSVTGVPLPRSAAPPHPTPEQHAAARSHGHTVTTVTRSLALRARPIDSPAPHAPRRSLSPAPESGRSPGGGSSLQGLIHNAETSQRTVGANELCPSSLQGCKIHNADHTASLTVSFAVLR